MGWGGLCFWGAKTGVDLDWEVSCAEPGWDRAPDVGDFAGGK